MRYKVILKCGSTFEISQGELDAISTNLAADTADQFQIFGRKEGDKLMTYKIINLEDISAII